MTQALPQRDALRLSEITHPWQWDRGCRSSQWMLPAQEGKTSKVPVGCDPLCAGLYCECGQIGISDEFPFSLTSWHKRQKISQCRSPGRRSLHSDGRVSPQQTSEQGSAESDYETRVDGSPLLGSRSVRSEIPKASSEFRT